MTEAAGLAEGLGRMAPSESDNAHHPDINARTLVL